MLDWLAAWPNVPFTIVGGTTLLFALVQASGVLSLLAGDGEADADADGGHDAGSIGAALLAPLAIGRVPLTWTVQTAGLAFALSGLAMNVAWLEMGLPTPLVSLAWTLPGAALLAYGTAALVARVVAPAVDDRPHAATSRRALVGSIGVVISSKVSEEFGEVRVRDRSGHDVRVVCKLAPGSRPLAEREEAVIVDCDESGTLFVAPFDTSVEARVEQGESDQEPETGARRERARAD